jgi:serine phosphatase RsbU (regulator of sigma subunit)
MSDRSAWAGMHDPGGAPRDSDRPVASISEMEITLLLVEDDEGDAFLVQDQLSDALPRARTIRSRTLRDALAQRMREVDCVLLDLQLPDATGLDAVGEVLAKWPATPLIVLTGLDDQDAGAAAVGAGAQDYLVKGKVDGDALARSIRYAIGRRRAAEVERKLLLAQAEAREAVRLERGLAPQLPLSAGATWLASCYRAGRSRALLGGDFYDAVDGRDGHLRLLVGDVCGHDADAAAIGVCLRSAWRSLALVGAAPSVVLDTLQQVFEHERHMPGLFTTLCTLEVLPRAGEARLIRAGHPSPVLLGDGPARALVAGRGERPIGLGDGSWTQERVALAPGWALLLYTDGIIEGRIGEGAERLGEQGLCELIDAYTREHADWRGRGREMLEELVSRAEQLNGSALTDDVAMVLVGMHADTLVMR